MTVYNRLCQLLRISLASPGTPCGGGPEGPWWGIDRRIVPYVHSGKFSLDYLSFGANQDVLLHY